MDEAEDRYEEWNSSIPGSPHSKTLTPRISDISGDFKPYLDFCKTVREWHEEIFNYFKDDKGQRFSNGPVEAIVGSVENISRAGYGYSFEALRGKMIYGESRYEAKTGRRKPKPTKGAASYAASYMAFMTGAFSPDILSDITAIFEADIREKLCLSPILDLYSKNIVTISDRPVLSVVATILDKAFEPAAQWHKSHCAFRPRLAPAQAVSAIT